jgi:hypothetical protein
MKLKKWIDGTPPHIYTVVKAVGKSYTLDNLPLKFLQWRIESVDNHFVENYKKIQVPENIEVVEVIHIMKE